MAEAASFSPLGSSILFRLCPVAATAIHSLLLEIKLYIHAFERDLELQVEDTIQRLLACGARSCAGRNEAAPASAVFTFHPRRLQRPKPVTQE